MMGYWHDQMTVAHGLSKDLEMAKAEVDGLLDEQVGCIL